MHALKVHLGPSLTDQVFAAWSTTLSTIVTIMLEGAKEADGADAAKKQAAPVPGPTGAGKTAAPSGGGPCGCFGGR